ncbi:MAG: hypothetical protein ACJ8FY_08575 [Gemmataceae bacterium]
MLKAKEIGDITLSLWYLPLEKLVQVRELVNQLRQGHGYKEPIDDSDEWSVEDERDFTRSAMARLDEEDPWDEPDNAKAV